MFLSEINDTIWAHCCPLYKKHRRRHFLARQRTPTYCSSFFGFLGRGRSRIVAVAPSIPRFIAHRKSMGYDGNDLPHSPRILEELQGAVSEAWEATLQEFTDNAVAIVR
jgi:hypothetical protein